MNKYKVPINLKNQQISNEEHIKDVNYLPTSSFNNYSTYEKNLNTAKSKYEDKSYKAIYRPSPHHVSQDDQIDKNFKNSDNSVKLGLNFEYNKVKKDFIKNSISRNVSKDDRITHYNKSKNTSTEIRVDNPQQAKKVYKINYDYNRTMDSNLQSQIRENSPSHKKPNFRNYDRLNDNYTNSTVYDYINSSIDKNSYRKSIESPHYIPEKKNKRNMKTNFDYNKLERKAKEEYFSEYSSSFDRKNNYSKYNVSNYSTYKNNNNAKLNSCNFNYDYKDKTKKTIKLLVENDDALECQGGANNYQMHGIYNNNKYSLHNTNTCNNYPISNTNFSKLNINKISKNFEKTSHSNNKIINTTKYNLENDLEEINDEEFTSEVKKIFGNNSNKSNLQEIQKLLSKNKIKEEFITKTTTLCKNITNTKSNINTIILWRWLKQTVNEAMDYQELKLQVKANVTLDKESEIKGFIAGCLDQNFHSKKKIDKVKKILDAKPK